MKYHCIQCNFDFEANPRSVMREGKSEKKSLTEPVKCPKCFNFLPVNPNKVRGSKGNKNTDYHNVFKGVNK